MRGFSTSDSSPLSLLLLLNKNLSWEHAKGKCFFPPTVVRPCCERKTLTTQPLSSDLDVTPTSASVSVAGVHKQIKELLYQS